MYDRTTLRSCDRTTLQGATFNMRGQPRAHLRRAGKKKMRAPLLGLAYLYIIPSWVMLGKLG